MQDLKILSIPGDLESSIILEDCHKMFADLSVLVCRSYQMHSNLNWYFM